MSSDNFRVPELPATNNSSSGQTRTGDETKSTPPVISIRSETGSVIAAPSESAEPAASLDYKPSPLAAKMMKLIDKDKLKIELSEADKARAKKIELKPGHSLVHWLSYAEKQKDLTGGAGVSRNKKIPMSELKKHNTDDDCWMALRGNVYNLKEFLDYHPGGSEVMEEYFGADGTQMFNYYHSFVNYEKLLASCQIGILDRFS